MSRRLERSRTNRVIAGVCGGIGEYLELDPTFVRVVMIVLGLSGIGILIYIVLLFLMPLPGESPIIGPSWVGLGDKPAGDGTTPVVVDPESAERRRYAVGILLVAVGAIFFLGNLGLFRGFDWKYIWPLVIILLGVYLIAQRTRR